jgi:carboxylesterase type B
MMALCRWTVLLSHLLLSITATQDQVPLSDNTAGPKNTPIIPTSSGLLVGKISDGVSSFKGIRYAEPPIGEHRWTPPRPYFSKEIIQADTFGHSCIQQFPYASQNLTEKLFNTPPVAESEDCLFLNVWAPTDRSKPKPVLVWIYGGMYAFGHGSHALYDGTTFAQNHSIIVVTFNYRTNVFGFPGYSANRDLPKLRNFGFMDQDLALEWVRENIEAFGGDPRQITINGQSAGSMSVGNILQRHGEFPPFRAAIMQSGFASSISLPPPDRQAFSKLVEGQNCTHWIPARRLECLLSLSTQTIKNWLNGPDGAVFSPTFDGVTAFCNPYPRILRRETANVPLLLGANEDEGSLFAPSNVTLEKFLAPFALLGIWPNVVRQLYPDRRDDKHIISDVIRDAGFICPSKMTAESFLSVRQPDIYRYVYGAKFTPEPFPDAGVWHGSEIPLVFGTYNKTNAPAEMRQLSETMQTMWANFIRDPYSPPHPGWPRYEAAPGTQTLAKLGFSGTDPENVIELSLSGVYDMPCEELWNAKFVDNPVGCLP